MMWFVTIEKNGKKQQRLMRAATAEDAGKQTCELVAGPEWAQWTVVRCVSAD